MTRASASIEWMDHRVRDHANDIVTKMHRIIKAILGNWSREWKDSQIFFFSILFIFRLILIRKWSALKNFWMDKKSAAHFVVLPSPSKKKINIARLHFTLTEQKYQNKAYFHVNNNIYQLNRTNSRYQ